MFTAMELLTLVNLLPETYCSQSTGSLGFSVDWLVRLTPCLIFAVGCDVELRAEPWVHKHLLEDEHSKFTIVALPRLSINVQK